MAVRHSSMMVAKEIRVDEERTLQVAEAGWSLMGVGVKGRCRILVAAVMSAWSGVGDRVFSVYLSERVGLVHRLRVGEDARVTRDVFFDLTTGESFSLPEALPHPLIWSIPGTNLILNGEAHQRSLNLKMFRWDEVGKTFGLCGDEEGLFEPMLRAFAVMPEVVVNSWGVVLTGWDRGGLYSTFLVYRVDVQATGLTFLSGNCLDEGRFFDYDIIDLNAGRDLKVNWTCLLGSSRLFVQERDIFTVANILDEGSLGYQDRSKEGLLREERRPSLTWNDRLTCLPKEVKDMGSGTIFLSGDRLLRDSLDGCVLHQLDMATMTPRDQKIPPGIFGANLTLNLPMDPSRLVLGSFYLDEVITVVDPVCGRGVSFEWVGGFDIMSNGYALVIFEEDLGGGIVPNWEMRAVVFKLT
ncbi:hypothetical protein HDU67_004272 [Dinochytrium kinnereticum]|nr:hypothetical protein HDU67_004272 [Dinochytrium kinnereticum]